jgi:predicted lipoprotein with Yx(FWY)xxD motif
VLAQESRARNEWPGDRTKLLKPMSRLLAIAGILVSLALTACGDDDGSTTATRPSQGAGDGSAAADRKSSSGRAQKAGSGTEVVVADSQYGPVLFDSARQAIYLFDRETSDASRCYGACAEAWPPVLTDGEPVGGDGVDTELLGTTHRDDGSTQVTYDGHPLYYYVHDPPGELLCHGVEEFGGLWLAVDPSGEAVQ